MMIMGSGIINQRQFFSFVPCESRAPFKTSMVNHCFQCCGAGACQGHPFWLKLGVGSGSYFFAAKTALEKIVEHSRYQCEVWAFL